MNKIEFSCEHKFKSGFELDLRFESDANTTAIFGPSGAGKSTILAVIAGLINPDSAQVKLRDQYLVNTNTGTNLPPENRDIGLVTQQHLLFPHLNVQQNLRYGQRRLSPGKDDPRESKIDFERVVAVLELADLLDRYPANLSGGERQRVSIGRALISRPALLLLDEPVSSLDAGLANRIVAYLDAVINEFAIPTLFVSHQQGHVRRLAEYVIVVDQGRLVTSGESATALGHNRALQFADASAPENLILLSKITTNHETSIGTIGDNQIQLPHSAVDSNHQYVQFSPTDIVLSKNEINGLSARNCLKGRVLAITNTTTGVFVAIDIGQTIWASITNQSAENLGIEPGVDINCYIKSQSLKIV